MILCAALACHVTITRAHDKAALGMPDGALLDIPADIGPYKQQGQDAETPQHVKDILQTNAILTRTYVSPGGWPIEMTIVHTGLTRGSLHFPEVCLVGQGWEIRDQYSAPVGFMFTGKRLVLFRGDNNQAVLYWFKTGDNLTGDYFLNTWYWILGKLTFKEPSSSMIRLSTVIGRQGEDVSFRVLEDFATQLAPILLEKIR
jgi:EpsI family protein